VVTGQATPASSNAPTSTPVEVQGIQVTRSTLTTFADGAVLAAPGNGPAGPPVAALPAEFARWLMIPFAVVLVLGGVGWAVRRMPAPHGRHRR
jgi:branched-subunit amino acid ABC-type transport system permease component